MISRGLEDPLWLAKVVIAQAKPDLVKQAVIDLIDVYDGQGVADAFESIDRLVQVAATGKYVAPYPHVHGEDGETIASVMLNADGSIPEDLSPKDRETLERFKNILGSIQEVEDPFEGFNLDDEDDEDEEDN